MARVLIGYSCCPMTRAAFEAQGHEVWTCDLLPSRDLAMFHHQCDVWEALENRGPWNFAVLHPMCTYLTVSAAWAFTDGPYHQKVRPGTLVGAERRAARDVELENFRRLLALPFPVAIENPAISFINTAIRRYDQVIHPFQFCDDASKATGLWLTHGTPPLVIDPAAYRAPAWYAAISTPSTMAQRAARSAVQRSTCRAGQTKPTAARTGFPPAKVAGLNAAPPIQVSPQQWGASGAHG